MAIRRPEFLPDASLDRDAMESMQVELANEANFSDADIPTPSSFVLDEPVEEFGEYDLSGGPVVVGVDQAFVGDEGAVSAAVAVQDGRIVEQAEGHADLDFPYIPGLLAFREAPAILDALDSLETPTDLLVFDGSGRIHYRQAGIATHVGVMIDVPSIGVAKSLLCGEPEPASSLDDPLEEGARIAIEADDEVDVTNGTVIGYAFQSRQYPNPEKRHVNPLFVSPGHRVSAESAVDLVEATGAGYKLPEPTRLADRRADELKH